MRKEIAMITLTKGEDRKDGMLFKKELIGKNHIGFNRFLGYSKWRPNSKKKKN